MKSEHIKKGQVLHVQAYGGPRLAFVYNVEGVRADLMFADGKRDSVFINWLASVSKIIC
jgi:hypothetical protein